MISKTVLCVLFALSFCNFSLASELWGGSFSKLNGRIIRSLESASFDPDLLLVGNKGKQAGDAKVIISRNGGVSWQFLNSNKSLHKSATDVQAVMPVTPSIMLAGTWKHGLYRSSDGGASFSRVKGFPSNDVRSLAVQGKALFAATGDRGIAKSIDNGQSWSTTSLDTGYFWSVRTSTDGSALLASSPAKGLFRSVDQGRTWQQTLADQKVSEASQSNSGVIAVAGDKGLYLSTDNGASWKSPKAFKGQRLSSVRFKGNSSDTLLVGGWAGGLWEYSIANNTSTRHNKTLPVLHVQETAAGVVTGSWGKGLHVYPAGASTPYLINASKAKDKNVVDQLLAGGANPDAYDAQRNTALTFASRDGFLQIAQSLIGNGADVNWIDGEGVTPLILASFKNHPQLVKLLLANGADKSVVDGFGRTALEYATRRSPSDPIAKMLKGG